MNTTEFYLKESLKAMQHLIVILQKALVAKQVENEGTAECPHCEGTGKWRCIACYSFDPKHECPGFEL